MERLATFWLVLLLAACAGEPVRQMPPVPLRDEIFAAPSGNVGGNDVFALSPAMRRYLEGPLAQQIRLKGTQRGLIDALYTKGQLRLTYDSAGTRNAAETFETLSGNCLSLVLMTSAFAKAVGLSVQYQTVAIEEIWSRSGEIYFRLGHVNLMLGGGKTSRQQYELPETSLTTTIDFLVPGEGRQRRAREIEERRVIAMYMNNKSGEALSEGRIDDAYWWARAAVHHDPEFSSAYNTLGVVYRRHGNLQEAERLFAALVDREPSDREALSNLILTLREQGHGDRAGEFVRRLARLEPDPPFALLERGLDALRSGNPAVARDLLEREVERSSGYHEVHFWLAIAYANLGERAKAEEHLVMAIHNSTSSKDAELYTAKLTRLHSPPRVH